MLVNYFHNVITYKGTDVIEMYHPMKLLTLSNWSEYSYYLMQYYPLLVVIPAGLAYYADKTLNQFTFIQSRVGARNYFFGKLIAVFIVTFLVFTVPFLIEILLNTLAFPTMATGDPSNLDPTEYTDIANMYLFSSLYTYSPYLYAIFFTLVFGIFSGILAIFTVSISTFPIKYKVLLFLPVYVLLHSIALIKQQLPTINVDTNYFFYLRFYIPLQNSTGSLITFFSFTLILLVLSILMIAFKIRKDAF